MNQIVLLDFGASRDYSKQFVDNYIKVIEGAAVGDHQKVLDFSRKLGFLGGYETKVTIIKPTTSIAAQYSLL